jgi:hypothetical protein
VSDDPASTEISEIKEVIRSDPNAYYGDQRLQTRYSALLEARRAGSPAPPISAAAGELAEMKKLVAVQDSAYWEGPRAQQLQARYAELLDQRDGRAHNAGPAVPRADRKVSQQTLDIIQRRAESIVAAVDDPEGFEDSFYRLPDAVQAAVYTELSGTVPNVRPASREAVDAFMAMPEGAALARKWGANTARNIAVFKARVIRALGMLDGDDYAHALDWVEGVSQRQAMAIAGALVD